MNIGQAKSLIVSVRKVTLKRCTVCGVARTFAIISREKDGAKKYAVRVSCRCAEQEYWGYDR